MTRFNLVSSIHTNTMKTLLYVLVLITVMTLGAFKLLTPGSGDTSTAIIEVTSLDENEEITFEGKYFTRKGDYQSQIFESKTTPFKIEVESTNFIALFQKLEGSAKMKVTMRIVDAENGGSALASHIGDVGLMIREEDNALTSGL